MQHLKIKFIKGAASSINSFRKGGVYSLPFPEAKSYLKAGIAIPVRDVEQREKAIKQPTEKRNVEVSNSTDKRTDKSGQHKNASKGNGNGRGQSGRKSNSGRKTTRRKISKKGAN